jgi:hypothetical protein
MWPTFMPEQSAFKDGFWGPVVRNLGLQFADITYIGDELGSAQSEERGHILACGDWLTLDNY